MFIRAVRGVDQGPYHLEPLVVDGDKARIWSGSDQQNVQNENTENSGEEEAGSVIIPDDDNDVIAVDNEEESDTASVTDSNDSLGCGTDAEAAVPGSAGRSIFSGLFGTLFLMLFPFLAIIIHRNIRKRL